MKTMTTREATERLAGLIEPKPDKAPFVFGDWTSPGKAWRYPFEEWQPAIDMDDMNDAIDAVEAAGFGYSVASKGGAISCSTWPPKAMEDVFNVRGNYAPAMALSLALLHALYGEAVEIVDEDEVNNGTR